MYMLEVQRENCGIATMSIDEVIPCPMSMLCESGIIPAIYIQ